MSDKLTFNLDEYDGVALAAALPQLRRGEHRAEVGAAHGEHQAVRLERLARVHDG